MLFLKKLKRTSSHQNNVTKPRLKTHSKKPLKALNRCFNENKPFKKQSFKKYYFEDKRPCFNRKLITQSPFQVTLRREEIIRQYLNL